VNDSQTSELARAIQDVTERTQVLIREEIELAKVEVTTKAKKLARGAAIGAAAGIFVVTGFIYFLHAASWLVWKAVRGDSTDNFWLGFFLVSVALFVLGGLAGFLAARLFKAGAPPTPAMAIEEGRLIKETLSGDHHEPGRGA
jgi:hypothetical protein